MRVYKWIVMDTGCADCGVDIVGGFSTEKKAAAIAAILNREFRAGRLDIFVVHGECINGQHLFRVYEMPERERTNPKYS